MKNICALFVCVLLFAGNIQLVNAMENDHRQEQEFHQKIQQACPECFGENVQAYYKKMEPVIVESDECCVDSYWYVSRVTINGAIIQRGHDGTYQHEGVCLEAALPFHFDPSKSLVVPVQDGQEHMRVRCSSASGMQQTPVVPNLDSYNDVIHNIQAKKLLLQNKVVLRGILRRQNNRNQVVELTCSNSRHDFLLVRGLEFVLNIDHGVTYIFFDFVDSAYNAVDSCYHIEIRHASVASSQQLHCIKEHKAYVIDPEVIYSYFDSLESRQRWVLDEASFYDLNKDLMCTLPSCYQHLQDHSEILREPVLFFLNDAYASFYEFEEIKRLDQENSYIYSSDGALFLTLPCKVTLKEHITSNRIVAFGLLQVSHPKLTLQPGVLVEGGHCQWPDGLYKRSFVGDHSSWQPVGQPGELINVFVAGESQDGFEAIWPDIQLTAQESKQWCYAAQQHFVSLFETRISRCNQELLSGFKKWDKLTALEMPRITLPAGITWQDIYAAIACLRQLKELRFENNNPVENVFAAYPKNSSTSEQCYQALAKSLSKLSDLQLLHIHGLWLKPHRDLGAGYEPNSWGVTSVSSEVATLTGIINHNEQAGIRSLITAIYAMKQLKNLSLDGIPSNGSSWWARLTNGEKGLAVVTGTGFLSMLLSNGKQQGNNLAQLAQHAATQISQMPALENITVYSPGGNCADYFSRDFKNYLAIAQNNIEQANFAITDGVLR